MDGGCSWLLLQGGGGNGNGGDMRRCTASCDSAGQPGLHHNQEEQEAIRSQAMEQQLSQIYMLMDMEDHEYAAVPPYRASLPSSSSSSFRSFSGSRDDNSSLMLTAASTATSCHHHPEVSWQIPLSPIAYADGHHQHSSSLDLPSLDHVMYYQEAHQEQARGRTGHGAAACAFRPYVPHLGLKKKLKPGASGQRAIKTAMSILSRMHMARLAQYYQMEMAAQARPLAPAGSSNCHQLQHVLSERKRREKLNDSFKALRTVLPPASKKDKASILIRAKDYVNTLKSRVSELEENNRMLEESQLHRNDDDGKQGNDADDKIEVDISRSAAEGTLECQEFHVKIELRSGCSVMDAAVGILYCLKEGGNVRLVAMNIDSSSSCLPRAKTFPRATVTLQMKSSSLDEDFLKESVIKAVKDVMQSENATP